MACVDPPGQALGARCGHGLCMLWVVLLGLALAQTLEEWLRDPAAPLLSPVHLRAYVPPPTTTVAPAAQHRFGLLQAVGRVLSPPNNGSLPRQQVAGVSEALEATDDYRRGLACLWSLGGVPRDLGRAYEYFYAAATEQQDADAMFMAGLFHATGHFFTQTPDPAQAILFYTLAGNLGNLDALLALAHRYRYGLDVPKDERLATQYYEDASAVYVELIEQGLLDGKHTDAVNTHAPDSPAANGFRLRPVNRNSGSFGAELNTGLYGQHNYGVRVDPANLQLLPKGDRSTALRFVQTELSRYDTVDEAVESLLDRAAEEPDRYALLQLARLYTRQPGPDGQIDWKTVGSLAKMCVTSRGDDTTLLLKPFCAQIVGERALWGEGLVQNTTVARQWFQYAIEKGKSLNHAYPYSELGLQLCDLLEAGRDSPEYAAALQKYRDRLDTEPGMHMGLDANLGMALAELYILDGELEHARRVLQGVQQDTQHRDPRSMLELAFLEEPLSPSVLDRMPAKTPVPKKIDLLTVSLRPTSQKLQLFARAFAAGESLLTPVDVAQAAYMEGDLETSFLAYAVCSELGVAQADINLADLFDVRHSLLGSALADRWPRLRALAEWPLPGFVANAVAQGAVDRRKLAVHYFGRAALHDSVDALSKLVEYAWHYQLVPPKLADFYLSVLEQSNMALGHWWRGMLLYAAGEYQRALNTFSTVLVNPDAWMPAKFSQFLTVFHLLRGDGPRDGHNFTWSNLFESYRGIIVVENESWPTKALVSGFPTDLKWFLGGVFVVIALSVHYALRGN